MSLYLDELTLFDRINLATCAMHRAQECAFDQNRFLGEYGTARAWNNYKCVITTKYSYVDNN